MTEESNNRAADGAASSPPSDRQADQAGEAKVKPWQVVFSTLAAGFGVQSSRNRERDFKQGKAGPFIVAGLLFTVLFIAGVTLIVNLVLSSAN